MATCVDSPSPVTIGISDDGTSTKLELETKQSKIAQLYYKLPKYVRWYGFEVIIIVLLAMGFVWYFCISLSLALLWIVYCYKRVAKVIFKRWGLLYNVIIVFGLLGIVVSSHLTSTPTSTVNGPSFWRLFTDWLFMFFWWLVFRFHHTA